MSTETERNISSYEAAYAADYDFEAVQVRYRREAVLALLQARKPGYVIEIGCGLEPLLPHYASAGGLVDRWVVVEPGASFAEAARAVANNHSAMTVIERPFDAVVAQSLVQQFGHVDLVICSCVLHEVQDQMGLLQAIRQVMGPQSVLHVNVPNAMSLHRRLAKAMGLIANVEEFSQRNQLLQQHRVYSQERLRADLNAAGLAVVDAGGIFLKPFTHSQMVKVVAALGEDILAGFGKLGQEFPELASEIFADAKLQQA
jgi:SAM-dependent methyltransferase